MVDLLKAFGRGILYILCFPFFLVALAIFAVIGLLAFIFQLIKSIIYFFTGQKFFPELPEDKELRLMREAEQARNNPQPQPSVNNQSQGGLLYEETYDEDDFLEEPAPAASPLPRPNPTIEEVVFEEEPEEEVSPIQAPVEEKPAPAPVVQEVNRPEPEPSKELIPEDNDDPIEDFLDPFDVEEEEPEEENLEVYRPKGTNDDTYSIDDDDDTDSGVNINFDDWGKR